MREKDYKPYTAKRWTDIPEPIVVGHTEFTEEEKRKHDEEFTEILREYGVIGEDEVVKDGKTVKK